MIQLVAVGYKPAAFLPGQTGVAAFSAGVDREGLNDFADLAGETVRAGGTVVAMYPRWAAEPSRRRLQTVRAALDTTRCVLFPVDLPPLAGSVMVSLAEAVRPHVDHPARLIGALPSLSQQIIITAWLSRLGGLRSPTPTVWQHAVSLLPWTAFGVTTYPEPTIKRLTTADPCVTLPEVSAHAELGLAVASAGGDIEWAREVLAPALGHPELIEVPPPPLAPCWWGGGPSLEAVIYPRDVAATAAHVTQRVLLRHCDSCAQESPFDVCPFCGVHQPLPLAASQTAEAGTRPPSADAT